MKKEPVSMYMYLMLHNQTDRKFKLEIAVNNQKTTRLIKLDSPWLTVKRT